MHTESLSGSSTPNTPNKSRLFKFNHLQCDSVLKSDCVDAACLGMWNSSGGRLKEDGEGMGPLGCMHIEGSLFISTWPTKALTAAISPGSRPMSSMSCQTSGCSESSGNIPFEIYINVGKVKPSLQYFGLDCQSTILRIENRVRHKNKLSKRHGARSLF